jgi:hypothetical protein
MELGAAVGDRPHDQIIADAQIDEQPANQSPVGVVEARDVDVGPEDAVSLDRELIEPTGRPQGEVLDRLFGCMGIFLGTGATCEEEGERKYHVRAMRRRTHESHEYLTASPVESAERPIALTALSPQSSKREMRGSVSAFGLRAAFMLARAVERAAPTRSTVLLDNAVC